MACVELSCYISARLGILVDCAEEKHIYGGNALGIELDQVGMCVLIGNLRASMMYK